MLEIDSPPPPPPPDAPADGAPEDVAGAVDPELLETADCKPLSNSDSVEPASLDAAPATTPAPPPCTLNSDANVLPANCEAEMSFETGGGADVVPWAVPAASPSKSCSRLEGPWFVFDVPLAAPEAAVPDVFCAFCPDSN